VTAAQALVDLRNQFDRYADPEKVEWHFAGVTNRWTKRALVASGFGVERLHHALSDDDDERGSREKGPLIAVGEGVNINSSGSSTGVNVVSLSKSQRDVEAGEITPVTSNKTDTSGRLLVPVYGINRPFFHVDIGTAVKSVVWSFGRSGSESA
jgi:sodium-independent sulfate anion transporter 11